jgi:hypothetical protein
MKKITEINYFFHTSRDIQSVDEAPKYGYQQILKDSDSGVWQ